MEFVVAIGVVVIAITCLSIDGKLKKKQRAKQRINRVIKTRKRKISNTSYCTNGSFSLNKKVVATLPFLFQRSLQIGVGNNEI